MEHELVLRPFELVQRKRAFVMRNITFADLKKGLESTFTPSAAAVILYQAGMICGRRSAERLMKQLGLRNEALLNAIVKLKKREGWASINFKKVNLKEKLGSVIVKNSFEAEGYGKSDTPVCHFLRGYLAGVLSQALNTEINLTETACTAKGDPNCEFQIQKAQTNKTLIGLRKQQPSQHASPYHSTHQGVRNALRLPQ
ncbi:MAG: V4R domain-containing protein [Candidatus Bathyarchaeia archaeon]